jgi:hypothetical protein
VPLTQVLGTLKAQGRLGSGDLQIRAVPQAVVRTGVLAAAPLARVRP